MRVYPLRLAAIGLFRAGMMPPITRCPYVWGIVSLNRTGFFGAQIA